MAAALHDPGQGYYARRIAGIGQRGDFTTSAAISPALGKAVASWAGKAMKEEACRDLIELGPGEGVLAEFVLRGLPWLQRVRTRLHLVESSKPLREIQRQRLGTAVHWHDRVEDALQACGGKACLYSNEFVDAFPARRFRMTADGWLEQHVLPSGDSWCPASDLPESSLMQRGWPEAQVVEVHQSYQHWLDGLIANWTQGRLLTIDYGAKSEDLYYRQPAGSLRAFFHHQRLHGAEVWQRPGHQDITTDVNFSDLIAWPGRAMETIRLETQSAFLWDFLDPNNPADRFVAEDEGSGGAFLCLDQRRAKP